MSRALGACSACESRVGHPHRRPVERQACPSIRRRTIRCQCAHRPHGGKAVHHAGPLVFGSAGRHQLQHQRPPLEGDRLLAPHIGLRLGLRRGAPLGVHVGAAGLLQLQRGHQPGLRGVQADTLGAGYGQHPQRDGEPVRRAVHRLQPAAAHRAPRDGGPADGSAAQGGL